MYDHGRHYRIKCRYYWWTGDLAIGVSYYTVRHAGVKKEGPVNNIERRKIVFRTKGSTHGPITRLVSPGDVGELIKPFVFLDYVNAQKGPGFGFHPHSGIATLTYPLTFDAQHVASTSQVDLVEREGVEWVVAGGGIWHSGKVVNGERAEGFQLWFALPPTPARAAA